MGGTSPTETGAYRKDEIGPWEVIFSLWVREGLYPSLMATGVKLRKYTGSLLHAKSMIADDRLDVVASLAWSSRCERVAEALKIVRTTNCHEHPAVPNKEDLTTFFKGFAMGAANVVPGVSGGTIAFITGIYERLIEALKAFDLEAVKLGCSFKILELWAKIDGRFLLSLGLGVITAFATLARILKYGLEHHPTLILSLFFGLIVASIPSVGKMIRHWSPGVVAVFLVGLAIAVSMAFMTPANENTNPIYLGACGVVALCSMIIPGVSGSFVLLLLGNYKLIMLDALSAFFTGNLAVSLPILIPVGIGAVVGLLGLSRFLSWLFRTHHDKAVGTITGFVAGSLMIIWPWKTELTQEFLKDGETKMKTIGYENWRLPDFSQSGVWFEVVAVLVGIGLIVAVEFFAKKKPETEEE